MNNTANYLELEGLNEQLIPYQLFTRRYSCTKQQQSKNTMCHICTINEYNIIQHIDGLITTNSNRKP
jgi:hypothetical protein